MDDPMPQLIPNDFTPDGALLLGRVILITGASSGLGRALAIECARAGASVILSGRNGAKLERVYDEIEALGAPQPAIAALDLALQRRWNTTHWRAPSARNSAGSTAWSTLRRFWATARPSNNTTCPPGARFCT